MVIIIFPACLVVSAQGAERDWKRAPALPVISTDSSRLRVERTRRSSFPTATRSPSRSLAKGARWPRTAQTTSRSVASSAANLPRQTQHPDDPADSVHDPAGPDHDRAGPVRTCMVWPSQCSGPSRHHPSPLWPRQLAPSIPTAALFSTCAHACLSIHLDLALGLSAPKCCSDTINSPDEGSFRARDSNVGFGSTKMLHSQHLFKMGAAGGIISIKINKTCCIN